MRNLIVCCDGTWNTPDESKGGVACPTNVVKLYHALVSDSTQVAYYHPGVGTGEGWWDRALGGGTGAGLDRNTMSAYAWLAKTYQPQDRIFIFGFSRGAYTARSCAGLISRYGLLDLSSTKPAESWSRVENLFAAYRRKGAFAGGEGCTFHNKTEGGEGTTLVHFIGVWDTVGALGIPGDFALLRLLDDPEKYRFHDTNLSKNVAFARHAVALDEKRASFAPTFWTNVDRATDAKQLWFAGVHSDVGGGYPETGLSDGALAWMIEEAEACSLRFQPGWANQLNPDPLAPLHDSSTGIFDLLKTRPRSVPCLDLATDLHASTRDRLRTPTLSQGPYWPTERIEAGESRTVEVFARSRWNRTGIYLEEGVEYSLSAEGEWLDHSDAFGPDGAKKTASFGDLARYASSILGSMESLYKTFRDSPDTDFWWTRRVESSKWFALIGFLANDVMTQGSELPEGQTFNIGTSCTITPEKGGYLYAFANDAWQTYGNNRGSLNLTVQRT